MIEMGYWDAFCYWTHEAQVCREEERNALALYFYLIHLQHGGKR